MSKVLLRRGKVDLSQRGPQENMVQQQQLANRDKEKIAKCLPPATGCGLQRALGISHGVSGCFAHDIYMYRHSQPGTRQGRFGSGGGI